MSDAPEYAAPARRADLAGLPPAWIGVGDLDVFYDENVAYAERLTSAGVPCELVTVPGMYHGADGLIRNVRRCATFTTAWWSSARYLDAARILHEGCDQRTNDPVQKSTSAYGSMMRVTLARAVHRPSS